MPADLTDPTTAQTLLHLHRRRQDDLAATHRPAAARGDATTAFLRAEGLAAIAAALALYAELGGSWWLFATAFLLPDVAMLGYLAGPRIGATAYNAAHTYVGPAATGLAGLVFAPVLLPVAAIWAAHIGFDRMLGYGLKRETGFFDTHLGPIGRAPGAGA